MAARKTRQPATAATNSSPHRSDDVADPGEPFSKALPPGRSRLIQASGLFALWFVALVTLALTTANPLTLNREQIRQADVVVEATIDDPATGAVRVVNTWPRGQFDETIVISELAELSVTAEETYLLPLDRNEQAGGFHIAPTPPPLSLRLIYPANDDSRRQLDELIGAPQEDSSDH